MHTGVFFCLIKTGKNKYHLSELFYKTNKMKRTMLRIKKKICSDITCEFSLKTDYS